jgi:DNA-binding CsgD family transcriptional regulator
MATTNSESPLTPLETDVLVHVARGYSTRQVAEEIGLSRLAVRTVLTTVRTKLGAASTVDAVARAVRRGLIEP